MRLDEICKRAHQNAINKGFHDDDAFMINNGLHTRLRLSWLAMIGEEVGEAVDCVRSGDTAQLGVELADIIIRVCDMAACEGIDLEMEVREKMLVNEDRERMHGRLS